MGGKRLCHRHHQNPKNTTANAKEEKGYFACPLSERFAFPFSPAQRAVQVLEKGIQLNALLPPKKTIHCKVTEEGIFAFK